MLIGCGWDGADERKMQRTFHTGKASFATFFDLACIGKSLGYRRIGLAGLSQHVLGLIIQKSKKVCSCSRWMYIRCVIVHCACCISQTRFLMLLAGNLISYPSAAS